jgi:hypothetical protein
LIPNSPYSEENTAMMRLLIRLSTLAILCSVALCTSFCFLSAQTTPRRNNTSSGNTTSDPTDPPRGQFPPVQVPMRRDRTVLTERTSPPSVAGMRFGAFVQIKFSDNTATPPSDLQTSFALPGIPDIGLMARIPIGDEWAIGVETSYAGYAVNYDRLNVVRSGITMPRLLGQRTYQTFALIPTFHYGAFYVGCGMVIPISGSATRTIPPQIIDIAGFRELGEQETYSIPSSAHTIFAEARIGADAVIYRDDLQEILLGAVASMGLGSIETIAPTGNLSNVNPQMASIGVRISYRIIK